MSAAKVAIHTCSERTNFKVQMTLYDGAPSGNGKLVATSTEDAPCGVLFVTLDRPGTWYLVVSSPLGAPPPLEGIYDLSVACDDIPSQTVDEHCGASYITCGDRIRATNYGFTDWHDDGSGDAVYLLTAWEHATIALSTCASGTSFDARVRVFDGPPLLVDGNQTSGNLVGE